MAKRRGARRSQHAAPSGPPASGRQRFVTRLETFVPLAPLAAIWLLAAIVEATLFLLVANSSLPVALTSAARVSLLAASLASIGFGVLVIGAPLLWLIRVSGARKAQRLMTIGLVIGAAGFAILLY